MASQDFDFNYTLGVEAYKGSQFKEAVDYLDKAVDIRPEHKKARYYLGLSLSQVGEKKKALKVFHTLAKDDPDNFDVHVQTAILEIEEKEPEQAKSRLLQLVTSSKLSPRQQQLTYYYLGLAEQAEENYASSIDHFDKAAQDTELAPAATYFKGVSIYGGGNLSGAIETLSRVVHDYKTSPYSKRAKDFINKIENGSSEQRQGFSFTGSVGGQYDSNVVLEPDTIEVSDEDDFRLVTLLGLRYDVASFAVMYNAYQSLHLEVTEFNVQNHRGQVQWSKKVNYKGKPTTFTIKDVVNVAFLSNGLNFFSVSNELAPSVSRQITDAWLINLTLSWIFEDFRASDNLRDNYGYNMFLSNLFKLFQDRLLIGLKAGITLEDAGVAYDLFRATAESQVTWNVAGMNLTALGAYYHDDYARNVLGRLDQRYNLGFTAAKTFAEHYRISAGYQRGVSISNVAAFAYNRHIVSFNLGVSF